MLSHEHCVIDQNCYSLVTVFEVFNFGVFDKEACDLRVFNFSVFYFGAFDCGVSDIEAFQVFDLKVEVLKND